MLHARRLRHLPLLALAAGLGATGACTAAGSAARSAARQVRDAIPAGPRTHADVLAFIDSLHAIGAAREAMILDTLGRSTEGRVLPLVIASRPAVRTPEEARASGRPIVWVQGNIHAGEVEGKEAVQAVLRDLVLARWPNALDSVVLVAVPIYNADGNEKLASQSRNRREQNGPERVGERANGQGLDLNRDYIKAEAPETRASLAAFRAWDPDVFVDLHTTNGSYHGYALTYAPPLHPSAPLGMYARDSMLPVLRERMRKRHGFETFDYGDFISEDTLSKGWATFDSRPRFGTNYYGLRGKISFLSEAFSHDPFEKRIASTYAFTREILSLVAERAATIRQRVSEASRRPATEVALRSTFAAAPDSQEVIAETLQKTGDTLRSAPGVRRGYRRTGIFKTVRMPVYERFKPTLLRSLPEAYLIAAGDTATAAKLRLHGIRIDNLGAGSLPRVATFHIDSIAKASRVFQGHNEVRLAGRWSDWEQGATGNGLLLVPTDQPLGLLAAYLLEPESDDGLTTWNHFDSIIRQGGLFPVRRATGIHK